jgi:hypothetical protein
MASRRSARRSRAPARHLRTFIAKDPDDNLLLFAGRAE